MSGFLGENMRYMSKYLQPSNFVWSVQSLGNAFFRRASSFAVMAITVP